MGSLPLVDAKRVPQPHEQTPKPEHLWILGVADGLDMCHNDRAPTARIPTDCWTGATIDLNAPDRTIFRNILLILNRLHNKIKSIVQMNCSYIGINTVFSIKTVRPAISTVTLNNVMKYTLTRFTTIVRIIDWQPWWVRSMSMNSAMSNISRTAYGVGRIVMKWNDSTIYFLHKIHFNDKNMLVIISGLNHSELLLGYW